MVILRTSLCMTKKMYSKKNILQFVNQINELIIVANQQKGFNSSSKIFLSYKVFAIVIKKYLN